jgi:FG-GAP-like repeat
MRTTQRWICVTSLLLFASLAQAQFLQLPQSENGTNLAYFTQATINKSGATAIVGITNGTGGITAGVAVSVLFTNGTGGFGKPITTALSGVDNPGMSQLLLGDFNDDGNIDVAIFGKDHVTGASAVAVMLGNGDGTFQAGKESVIGGIGVPSDVCGMAAGDYNDDSKLDIVYVTPAINSSTLVVLPGNGNGTFSAPLTSSIGVLNLFCVAAGDFNNDKKLDAALSAGGSIYMALGNGNGTFKTPFAVTGHAAGRIAAAQLNADNNLDLIAVSAPAFGPAAIYSLLGDGTGHFPTVHSYPGPPGFLITGYAVQDLNGDNHPDVVVVSDAPGANSAAVSVLLNNGNGSFSEKTYNGDGSSSIQGFFAGDLNGDNRVDLAFANSASGFSILTGNGNGTFQGNLLTPTRGILPEVGDFNGDGKPDLILAGSPVRVLLGNGDGTFTPKANTCDMNTIAQGDYNNDKKVDIAGNAFLNSVSVVSVCLGNGDGTFTSFGNFDQGILHELVVPGNFTNNGKLSVAASDQNGFSVFLGEGTGAFENGIPTPVDARFPQIFPANFTADTKVDIVALTDTGVAVFPGNGDGTFGAPIVAAGSPKAPGGFLTVTDLNGDGKKDVVVTRGGAVSILIGNGDGTFNVTNYSGGNVTTRAVVGDFNGDGKLDIAFGSISSNSEDAVGVMFGDGTGKFTTPPTIFRTGGPIVGIASADFNLDKKPDLAVLLQDNNIVMLLNQE